MIRYIVKCKCGHYPVFLVCTSFINDKVLYAFMCPKCKHEGFGATKIEMEYDENVVLKETEDEPEVPKPVEGPGPEGESKSEEPNGNAEAKWLEEHVKEEPDPDKDSNK